nr:MAG TPA: hypothetical protein [Caudoviricetes sp.]
MSAKTSQWFVLLDCRLAGSLLVAWSEPHGQP